MIFIIVAAAALIFLLILWVLYVATFAPMRHLSNNYRCLPKGRHYDMVHDEIMKHIDELEKLPCEDVTVKSYDGLTLYGRYYEREQKDVIEIDFHGYRGHAIRDYCAGSKINSDSGRSSIIIEERAHGRSEGKTITFGIRERYDVLTWVNYVNERFGPDVKIILAGVSMGASTVLMASGMDLPGNVVAVVADCPYSSPKEIICKVARDKGLNDKLVYPLIKLSAKLFANLDIEEASPVEAVKKSKTPTIIAHGTDDRFVPYEMGKRVFEECAAQNKKMLSIEGAGHATSYFTQMDFYVKSLNEFLDGVLKK